MKLRAGNAKLHYGNQNSYKTNYLLLWRYPVRNITEQVREMGKKRISTKTTGSEEQLKNVSLNVSFDLRVNLLKRLRHQMSIR